VGEAPMPHVGAGDVLVQIHVASVNRTDCGFRAASPFIARLFTGLRRPKQTILGNEFAGEVVEVGRHVTSFTSGDRVFGYNEGPFGCHAEYLSIPEQASIAPTPDGIPYEIAAASTEGAHYALSFIRAARIRGGQTVLVNGATGAIGSAAVQILDHLGADVTAVCAGEHAELVADLGANRVIDYTTQDFTADDMIYDVVLDAVGKSTFARSRRILKPHGIYLSSELGPWVQNPMLALATPLLRKQRVMFPIPKHDRQIVTYLGELVHSGAFVPLIDRIYPLEDIVEAYRYVESGQKIGNVLITVV
jgi:NADPH:quinone reductase-like Zn-dependent oxidoreductase